VSKTITMYTGEIGIKVLERLKKNASKGHYGSAIRNAMRETNISSDDEGEGEGGFRPSRDPGIGGNDIGDGSSEDSFNRSDASESPFPGVVVLGKARYDTLLRRAQKAEVDVMILFEIKLTKTRKSGTVKNDTKIRIVNVRDRRKTYSSATLNNISVWKKRADERYDTDEDPIDKVIDKLFKYIDANLKLSPMPDLTPEQAFARIRTLVSEEYDNPLPVLAEIRYYHTKGLIKDDILLKAYAKLIGDNAADQLVRGVTDDKKEALADYLP